MSRPALAAGIFVMALACDKSDPPAPAPSSAPAPGATPVEPAPRKRSARGTLEVSGAMNGTFRWSEKRANDPISCAWSAEKQTGGFYVDVNDESGRHLVVRIDPPSGQSKPRLFVITADADLPGPLTTDSGFTLGGDATGLMTATFDTTLTEVVTAQDPDEKNLKSGDKKADPQLTLKGTLEIDCPPTK